MKRSALAQRHSISAFRTSKGNPNPIFADHIGLSSSRTTSKSISRIGLTWSSRMSRSTILTLLGPSFYNVEVVKEFSSISS